MASDKTSGWRYFSLEGRIGRGSFFIRELVALGSLIAVFFAFSEEIITTPLLQFVLIAGMFWFSICTQAKRMHDCNRSLFESIKVSGLFFLLEEGTPGRNEYGNPDNG